MPQSQINDICPNCQLGRLQQVSKPYFRVFRAKLYVLPQTRCFQCDVCQFSDFDAKSLLVFNRMFIDQKQSVADKTQPLTPAIDDEINPISRTKRL